MTVSWTPASRDDLRRIEAWLQEHASDTVALTTLTTVRTRADFLVRFPRGGRPYGTGRILRALGTPYLIHYRIVAGQVQVLRVYHEREDWYVEP